MHCYFNVSSLRILLNSYLLILLIDSILVRPYRWILLAHLIMPIQSLNLSDLIYHSIQSQIIIWHRPSITSFTYWMDFLPMYNSSKQEGELSKLFEEIFYLFLLIFTILLQKMMN